MLDKKEISEFINSLLEGTDMFLVDVRVSKDNRVEVEIDSDSVVSIEECEKLTREIEGAFDRDAEDYELEVGSAGITSPFKVKRQYLKYIGREVEVMDAQGKKHEGILKEAGEDTFTIASVQKVRKEGLKRPVKEDVDLTFRYPEVKYTKYLLKF